MSDEKVVTLPTGYKPEDPPITMDALTELQWGLSLLSDEIKAISIALNHQTRILRELVKTIKKD